MSRRISALLRARVLLVVACAGCAQGDDLQTSELQVGNAAQAIFGGLQVAAADPVARASVALLEGDGEQICSGTLIAPRLIVSAAHCFTTFRPFYVSFGVEVAQQHRWTDDLDDRTQFPNLRNIVSFVVHPDYDPSVTRDNAEELRPASDLAVAMIADGAPLGFVPARIIAPSSGMVTDITIAGFGGFPEYDAYNPQPPRLRKVDTFLGAVLPQSGFLKDGPNPGKGSCVRDSGGSVYARTNLTDSPVLIGNVVSGPLDCSQGIGYNADLRRHVAWIEQTTGASLSQVCLSSSCHTGVVDAGEACDGGALGCTDWEAK